MIQCSVLTSVPQSPRLSVRDPKLASAQEPFSPVVPVPPDPACALAAAATIATTAIPTAQRAMRSGRRMIGDWRRRYSVSAPCRGGPSYMCSFVAYGVS